MLFFSMLKRRWLGIIGIVPPPWTRGAAAAVAALLLSGCSMVGLGYNRLPDLGLWWLNRQLTLTDAQTAQVRSDITALLAWHRRTQLPPAADLLRSWQTLVAGDVTADQVCGELARLRGFLDTLAQEATPALTRLARGTTPEQLTELQQNQRKSNEEFRETHLVPDPQAGLNKRLGTLKDRYRQLYGSLNDTQAGLLQEGLRVSHFQPERTQTERERRQMELVVLLRTLQRTPSDAPDARQQTQAQESVHAWLTGLTTSPRPEYAAYAQQMTREGCEQFAALHRSATGAQKTQAVRTLRAYEQDLRALAQR
jgi:hypothetical protein